MGGGGGVVVRSYTFSLSHSLLCALIFCFFQALQSGVILSSSFLFFFFFFFLLTVSVA